MNRRSFFGFACGGIVAAPAAVLVGSQPVPAVAKKADVAQMTVKIAFDQSGDIQAYIDGKVRELVRFSQRDYDVRRG